MDFETLKSENRSLITELISLSRESILKDEKIATLEREIEKLKEIKKKSLLFKYKRKKYFQVEKTRDAKLQ